MTPDLTAAKQRADRLAAALEHSGIGDWTWDRERDVVTLSPTAARISSVSPGEHQGWERMRGLIHPEDRGRARAAAQRAVEQGADYEVEARVRGQDGWRWILSRGHAMTDERGRVRGLVGTVEDITRRKREEEADRLLAQIGDTVASSLDVPTMLDELGRLLIQRFADGCAIDLLDADDTVRRVVLVTRDPAKAELVRELERRFPTPMDAEAGNVMAIRSGQPQLFPVITDEILRAASASDEHLDLWYRIDMRSVICVPLIARGRTIGAISIVSHTEGLHYDEQDLTLAVEVARRAALAIDNARLFEAEREARAAAELANGAKSRFLAMMSHELRTPLNAIVGYSDLMAHGVGQPLDDQQRGYIERIRGSAMFLSQIIQEILAFSQLEAGREDVVAEEIDAREVVSSAAGMVRPMAIAAGLDLNVTVPDDAVPVRTDPRKLTQVVLNLLSNAVKFTERGAVSVSLARESESLIVRVADTGVGIPADALQRVFEPFTQVDSSPTRRQGGTGLGLTVAARLARLLGGGIDASSEPGRGSVFTVVLPVAAAAAAPAAVELAPPGIVAETTGPS